MYIKEVNNRKSARDFLDLPRNLYKNDPSWVCPQDRDIIIQFDPVKNPFFENGEAKRWILISDSGKTIGRIAAFYNEERALAEKIPTGGCGFFECIDDRKAAFLLFDTAADWLRSKGMKAMDAPINFGENDSLWGLLVEGFTHPGMGMPYNFPYYKDLFENYGFHIFFRQYSYHLDLKKPFPERFWKIAEWISKKPDFHFEHFNWKNPDKYIKDTVEIYSEAWSVFKEDFTPLKEKTLRTAMEKARPILDPEMIWFAYHKEKPVAFFIMMPDVNQIFKELNGKMHIFNMLRFLLMKRNKKITRIRAMAAGVTPKFQNSGVESGIFWHMNEKMQFKPWYDEIELSWVGDYNPKMIALYEAVGGKRAKIHHTYRYMLDNSIPFERFMAEKIESKITTLHEKRNQETH